MDPASDRALPFHAFVLVCDRDRDVGPRSADAFQKMLRSRAEVRSDLFRGMLTYCAENYGALWRDYAASAAPIDLHRFHRIWGGLAGQLPASDLARLETDLSQMARALCRAAERWGTRRSRKKAYADFLHVLRERSLPADAQAPPPPPQARPEPALRPDRDSADGARPATPAPAVPVAAKALAAAGPAVRHPGDAWSKGPLTLVCTKITEEARDAKTFSFRSKEWGWFRYDPGQFVTVEPVIDGAPVARSYTISSTPSRPALIEITVKRVAGGLVSNWLHDTLRAGNELKANGPFGKFSCLRLPKDKYLFLSAGSGVTPVMSMLRYLHDTAAEVDVIFFQSARTEAELVFREELTLLQEVNRRIRVALCLTSPGSDDPWDGLRGRLDNAMLHRIAPDFLDRGVLACGPGGFMDKAKQLLAGNGFPLETQFDEESFVPRVTAPRAGAPRSGVSCKIVFARSGKVVDTVGGQTILEAAEACGISVPSACRQGRCGTCRATKLAGDVKMTDQEALAPDEIAEGEVLTCIAEPTSPTVELDL